MMASLVLSASPVVIFYLLLQKYIIKGGLPVLGLGLKIARTNIRVKQLYHMSCFLFSNEKMLAKNTKHLTEKEKNRKINIEVVTCFRKNEEKRFLKL